MRAAEASRKEKEKKEAEQRQKEQREDEEEAEDTHQEDKNEAVTKLPINNNNTANGTYSLRFQQLKKCRIDLQ